MKCISPVNVNADHDEIDQSLLRDGKVILRRAHLLDYTLSVSQHVLTAVLVNLLPQHRAAVVGRCTLMYSTLSRIFCVEI